MQNPILKFRQSSCISEKPGYLSENLSEILRAPTTVEFNIVWLKFCERFFLTNFYKSVCGIFSFGLDLDLLIKLFFFSVQKPDIFDIF